MRSSSFFELHESGNSRTLPAPSQSPSNPPDPARPTSRPSSPRASFVCQALAPTKRARACFELSIMRAVRVSHAPLTRRPDPPHRLPRRPSLCRYNKHALRLFLPSSCGAVSTNRDGRDGTLARALRAARLLRGALAPHASARSLVVRKNRATPRLSVLSTSVAGRRSCLASSLRSSRAERGSGARIATGRPSRDARGRERITGGSSPPQSSRGFIALALPPWFSRPVAGRRSCLASSLSSPFRAERGSGARIATGNVRATRAARMHPGWFLTAATE